MTTEFEIRRADNELHFHVVEKSSIILRWSVPVILAVVFGFVFSKQLAPAMVLIVAFGAGFIGVFALRNRFSDLQISNVEFVARGQFGGRYNVLKVIPRADILGFTFKKHDFSAPIGRPRGLYAKRRFRSTCILAYLDENQCNETIETIYERFPEMRMTAPVG
jgi:hypothetical protein